MVESLTRTGSPTHGHLRCSGSHSRAVYIRYRRIAATFSFFSHTVMEKSFTIAADRFRLWQITLGAGFPVPSRYCNARYSPEANCWPHLQLITGGDKAVESQNFMFYFFIFFFRVFPFCFYSFFFIFWLSSTSICGVNIHFSLLWEGLEATGKKPGCLQPTRHGPKQPCC